MFGHLVEHRLQIQSSGADGVEHVGHRCLALERRVEVVEQTGVLDRNRRLVGEGLQDRCLLLVERPNLEASDVDVADPLTLAEQWNRGEGTHPGGQDLVGERHTGSDGDDEVVHEERLLRLPSPKVRSRFGE